MSQSQLQDHDAERTLLAAIANSPELMDEFTLTPEFFTNTACIIIFDAMLELHRGGRVISSHSICVILGAGRIEQIGGRHVVMSMIEYVPPGAAPVAYESLCASLMLRRIQSIVRWGEAMLGTPHSIDGVRSLVTDMSRRVSGVDVSSDGDNITVDCADRVLDRINRMDSGRFESGFQTSVDAWNNQFGGIFDGGYYCIAGRPSTGKSALMEQFIFDYMKAGKPVAIFERDMSPVKLMERMACRISKVPYWRFYRGHISANERQWIREAIWEITDGAYKGLMRVFSPTGLTAHQFCAMSRREIRQHGVRCVFLDHIGALNVGRGDDRRNGLTAASLEIRGHVTDTNIPHIVLAHLNRTGGDGKPSPSHIKEFDQLYGDVDGMLLLYGGIAGEQTREVNFYAAKNREGGETEVASIFNGPEMTFENPVAQ